MVVQAVQAEEEVTLGSLEQGMRQMLQELGQRTLGQQTLGQLLARSNRAEARLRCPCGHNASYRCRRAGMVMTVFGRVSYTASDCYVE